MEHESYINRLGGNRKDNPITEHEIQAESQYWTDFYETHEFLQGSTFSDFIISQENMPSTVMDFGCGDGRDSFAIAHTGKQVLGLDRSPEGVQHGNSKSGKAGLTDRLSFRVCDVSDTNAVQQTIEDFRANDQPVLFYMRFFLHSIPEEIQDSFLKTLSSCAKPGDIFAAEFRTDKDEDLSKNFGVTHYRRYQNAQEFSDALQFNYDWEIGYEQESRGLAPYKDEDPYVYRVVATKK